MLEMVASQTLKYFKSAIKKARKESGQEKVFIWLMYKSETEPYCYLQTGNNEPKLVEPKELFNFFDRQAIEGFEALGFFVLETEIASMIKDSAERNNIPVEMIRFCISENKGHMLVNLFDGEKEMSCKFLKDELV